ncbi:hypothetical protein [Kitasatospora cineracea]|uniref:hypothetical protein n=1 Tax=Kitasatospora cineracea TaxID=88074 RepID=UPI0038165439
MTVDGVSDGAIPDETAAAMARRKWRIGRQPQTAADWMTEVKLLDETLMAIAQRGIEDRERAAQFQLGRMPQTSEEIEAEVRLRDTERRWEVELKDRTHRAELAHHQVAVTRRAESIRGWALVAVVVAIVISPWAAMLSGVPANDFSMYMVPVTGIAGTIIGYWFGQGAGLEDCLEAWIFRTRLYPVGRIARSRKQSQEPVRVENDACVSPPWGRAHAG